GNREAVAAEIDAVVARLSEAAELLRSEDAGAIAGWHESAGRNRRGLIEAGMAGGPLHELRLLVPNRPGSVAQVALGPCRALVSIEEMALYRTADMTSGAILLYVAGDDEAQRAEELIEGLGHDVARAER